MRDETSVYKATVVCVTDFIRDENTEASGDVTIVGHAFNNMRPSWQFEDGSLNFARFHSYIVKGVNENASRWKGSDMIGKGMPLQLKLAGIGGNRLNGREPHQEWVVHLLDHCLPSS